MEELEAFLPYQDPLNSPFNLDTYSNWEKSVLNLDSIPENALPELAEPLSNSPRIPELAEDIAGPSCQIEDQDQRSNDHINEGDPNATPRDTRDETTNCGNENPQNSNTFYENTIPLLTWPPPPAPFSCSCCQVLREIIHTNGSVNTKLEVHGRVGIICHAILEFHFSNEEPPIKHQMIDFSTQSMETVKQFLMQYCQERQQAGFVTLQDPFSTFYDTLSVGLNWDKNANTTEEFVQPHQTASGVEECQMNHSRGESSVVRAPLASFAAQVVPATSLAQEAPTTSIAAQVAPATSLAQEAPTTSHAQEVPTTSLAAQVAPTTSLAQEAPTTSYRAHRKTLKLDDVASCFHLPIEVAAKKLAICPTVLKKICRRNGIPRWPHRKIKSCDRKISDWKLGLNAKDVKERARAQAEIKRLMQVRDRACNGIRSCELHQET